MNSKEFKRLGGMVVTLLKSATVDNFQYTLTDLPDITTLNCPRSRLFPQVSDLLTCKDIIAEVGDWVVAEVEGTKVQFNRLSTNIGSQAPTETIKK